MNQTVSELTNKWETTERDRRWLAEQLEEARNNTQRLTAMVRELGGNPADQGALAGAGLGRGAPRINAVVNDVRTIGGRQYATISVGSADDVRRGMQFNLVNRESGDFLGVLTVTAVEPNESTGVVEGPRINDVRRGATEARTQSAG